MKPVRLTMFDDFYYPILPLEYFFR